jgi:Lrp/AsnC family leucine-responsive transcriptional regulator
MKRLQNNERPVDEIDSRLLILLDGNARLSVSDLARQVGLSSPSVTERLRRLEQDGVIRSFTIDVDHRRLGYQLRAMVRIRPLPGKIHIVERLIQDTAQIIECDKITGDDAFLARLVVRDVEEMDEILHRLVDYAVTSTAIIKSTSVERRLPPIGSG